MMEVDEMEEMRGAADMHDVSLTQVRNTCRFCPFTGSGHSLNHVVCFFLYVGLEVRRAAE